MYHSRPRILLVLVWVLLAGVGFCLFDMAAAQGHGHDHDSPRDLCLGMVAITLILALLAGPVPSGWTVTWRAPLLRALSAQVLDPPPRVPSLA